ncbi:MAG: hypothetical protein NTW67_06205 [Candidatus Woesearchaeota archaeon]|nr:hypothetical protein [Candidatus Woesearchaeota archaeon]
MTRYKAEKLTEHDTRIIGTQEFCAVIEVTNGVSDNRLSDKVQQAIDGRAYIRSRLPGVPIYAGLIFHRNTNVMNLNSISELDFVLQVQHYERNQMMNSIDAAIDRIHEPESRRFAHQLGNNIRRGANIDKLFYPNEKNWPDLKKNYNTLVGKRKLSEYQARVARVKGPALEEYVKRSLEHKINIPFIKGPIEMPQGDDIDVVVAGPESLVLGRLTNAAYFLIHMPPTPVPK